MDRGAAIAELKAQYRPLANPRQFDDFLDGRGVLADREDIAQDYDYDHNARKLDFERHFRALVLLHVTDYTSGRDLAWAAEEDLLFEALKADFTISVPGLSGAMKKRPVEPYWVMLDRVMQAVSALPHHRLRGISKQHWQQVSDLFEQVDIFDATQMRLPPSLSDWAQRSPEKSSFKLQLKLSGLDGHFQEALITPSSGNDNAYFSDLLDLKEGAERIYLFDCGYFKLDRYHEITHSGNYFVTKLHGNIKPDPVAHRPISDETEASQDATGYRVLRDSYVRLGEEEEAWYRVLHVELASGKEISLLTNLLWLAPAQICLLYRYRWSVEIVFRWLKSLLQLDHFVSRDPRGVVRQLVVALVVWGLLILWNEDGDGFSPKMLWRKLQAAMHEAIFELGRRYAKEGREPPQST